MPALERVHTTPPLVDAAGFAWPPEATITEPCAACDTEDERCVVCNSTGQIRFSARLDRR